MTKMEKQMGKLSLFRVYGHWDDGNFFDEYCWAASAQHAVDRVREWHKDDGGVVEEVAKVLKGWK